MELPLNCSSPADLQELRDQFDFAHTVMVHAVSKNIASFTLAGLRVPMIVHDNLSAEQIPETGFSPLEVVFFQDHLHDRIIMLARNNRMLREIWAFNERTRGFREFELSTPGTTATAIGHTASLVSALRSRSGNAAIDALKRSLAWRTDQLAALAGGKSVAI